MVRYRRGEAYLPPRNAQLAADVLLGDAVEHRDPCTLYLLRHALGRVELVSILGSWLSQTQV